MAKKLTYHDLLTLAGLTEKFGPLDRRLAIGGDNAPLGNYHAMAYAALQTLTAYLDKMISRTADLRAEQHQSSSAQLSLLELPQTPANPSQLTAAFATAMTPEDDVVEDQEFDDDDDGEEDDDDDDDPDPEPSLAASEVDGATLRALLALAQPDRTLPPAHVFDQWTEVARFKAYEWAMLAADGKEGGVTPPEILFVHLEDLDLESYDDRIELLDGLDAEFTHADSWTEEEWKLILGWAVAAHKFDRGDGALEELEVPEIPAFFLPESGLFDMIKSAVFHQTQEDGGPDLEALIDSFDSPGVKLAVHTLLGMGEMTLLDAQQGRFVEADSEDLISGVTALEEAARDLGSRRLVFSIDDAGNPQMEEAG